MPYPLNIELDQFKFEIIPMHYVDEDPDPTCTDSADDFRGTRELEWKMIYAVEHDEKGRVIQCGYLEKWMARLSEEYGDRITQALWAMREQQKAEHHTHD